MRLLLSIRQHGLHPAAWRMSDAPIFAATAFLDIAKRAEKAALDVVLLGLPALSASAPGDGSEAALHFDPLPLMGAALGVTERVGLAGFWPLDVAEPFHVARVMATLDHLSGGRAAWITGLSGAEPMRSNYGHSTLLDGEDAARRAAEFIEVAVKLWDSWEDRGFVADQASGLFADSERVHPILHEGAFFTVRGPLNVPRPIQGRPVIMHRDSGPGPLRRVVAPLADLVLAPCPTPEAASALKRELAASASGRRPLLIASVMPVLARTEADAMRRARELDAMAPCTAPRFVGTPEAFAAELSRWQAAGACDGFDLQPAVLTEDLDLICEEVLPALRHHGRLRRGYEARTLREHLGLDRPDSQYAAA